MRHQQGQDRGRDQRGDEGATAQHVGDDGDREHHAGHEPRAALSAADTAGHHDHGDTGDGGERGGGLGHAEREDRLHRVETASQGRRRRDDHVDQAVEEEQAARPATHGALTPLLLESLDGDGKGIARGPGTDRRWPPVGRAARRCRATIFRGAAPGDVGSRRRRAEPGPCSPLRSRRRRVGRPR